GPVVLAGPTMRLGTGVRKGLLAILGCAAASAALVTAPAPAGAGAPPAPRAVAGAPRYSFGTRKQGAKVVHAVVVTNHGTTPLRITRIALSAPGMTARAEPVIGPGTEEAITLEWDTAEVSRQVTGTATVVFDDPKEPELTLALSGTVRPPIEALPRAGFFIALFRDQRVERSITIINHQQRPLDLRPPEVSSRLFRASLSTRTPGEVYALTVTVPAGLPAGRYGEMISLDTDDPKVPRLQLPVNLLIKTDVYATPDHLDFGVVNVARLTADPRLLRAAAQKITVKKRHGKFAIK